MVRNITSIILDTFYAFFSPFSFETNFFQAGLIIFIILCIIGFFVKSFIKSI